MVCTSLGSLLRPLFYFLCSNLKANPVCKRYGVALHSRYFAIKLGAATAIYLESGQNLVYFGKVVKIPGPQLETKSHSRVRWQPMPPLAAT